MGGRRTRDSRGGAIKRRGFTMVEALVSIAILTVGIVGALGALGEMTKSEARLRESEMYRRFAKEKYDEIVATGELINAPLDGDFEDRGQPNLVWSLETEPNTLAENLLNVRVVVHPSGKEDSDGAVFATVRYQPPNGGAAEVGQR